MTENPIENALSKGTFSIVAAVQGSGTTYPVDQVVVNSDLGTAYEIAKLEQKANRPNTDIDAIDAEIKTLQDKMKQNSYTFHMRGISPGMDKSIADDNPIKNDDYEQRNYAYLAAHIIKVEDAEGAVDEKLFTKEDVATIKAWLPDSEFDKLYSKMNELTFQARYIDNAMSADFLSKR